MRVNLNLNVKNNSQPLRFGHHNSQEPTPKPPTTPNHDNTDYKKLYEIALDVIAYRNLQMTNKANAPTK